MADVRTLRLESLEAGAGVATTPPMWLATRIRAASPTTATARTDAKSR
jgi:hypothetical protein